MEKGPSTYAEYWISEEQEVNKFNKHKKEFSYTRIIKYSSDAVKLSKAIPEKVEAFLSVDGSTYWYNPKTKGLVIVSRNGRIVTYFKPRDGFYYVQEEYNDHGAKWLYRGGVRQ